MRFCRMRQPVLQFESPASAELSNLYLAEAKSADAVLPNAAAGAAAPACLYICLDTYIMRYYTRRSALVNYLSKLTVPSPDAASRWS